jgi:hypothetical protein
MNTDLHLNDEPFKSNHEPFQASNWLTMSVLERAMANLLLLPEYRAIAREHGQTIAKLQVTQNLRNLCPELFTAENTGLNLSPRLKQAIENLLTLPEFRAIAQQHGEAVAKLRATQLLRETRPELFRPGNPGDVLARLFADLESGKR